jgi:hypothetical protein
MKIKPKDIKPLREQILKEQHGLCAICHELVLSTEAVLDHCHKTGYIRAVLHRGCNAYIGHLENNMARNRITPNRLNQILTNFPMYIANHRLITHPSHLTPEEQKERAKKRARAKRAKK